MSFICPAGCGKKFTTEHFVKRHVEVMHKDDPAKVLKRKGWATPYGFVDFKEPVTYEEALSTSQAMHEMFVARKTNQIEGGQS